METSGAKNAQNDDCVRVAVNIRPLITTELLLGCTDCISVVPGEPQVQIASHSFTYDYVYGSPNSASTLYEDCVAPLVDSLFHGYNATVLAYGQTGSGKTYTMGTNYTGEVNSRGIIPHVMEAIFEKVKILKENIEFLIRVSFIEIFKEEVFDLLDLNHNYSRIEGAPSIRQAMPARVPIQIRETTNGGISLAGVSEPEVCTKEEMASFLARGSLSRATGSTNMNSQSSRSHAIFTISIEQRRNTHSSDSGVIKEDAGDDILSAKLHLVDLAGSERAKRTGADGIRLKEGIHINRGLLALGNVISALGDEKKRKEGCHVPYRDSKLTRLLQDSLGGNSKTVMIACVSPADTNAEETINTLKYANRARNIQNKAVVNRDPATAQIQKMRSQIEQLQSELLYFRGGGTPFEEIKVLEHKISLLEASNSELRQELSAHHLTCSRLEQQALDAQVERDKLVLKLESARNGKSWEDIDNTDNNKETDIIKNYVSKIQELETELLRAQSFSSSTRLNFMDCLDLDDNGIDSQTAFSPSSNDDIREEDEKEREHSTLQDKLGKELQELDKELEQKEEEMKHVAKLNTSIIKQHYEKKLLELEQEKKALQKEIEDLRCNLSNISSCSDDSAKKLKEEYLQKLNFLESQVSELKKKQEAQSQLLRQKQKSDDAAKRLQDEIQRIKSQKVQLQHKIKQESEQFRVWKASREKEVLQLKKEGRRNEYEMHKLLALNQRQKMVLQRKTEEASLATKRLKELLEAKKSSRETYGSMNMNGRGAQALMVAIEHELDVIAHVHEVRAEYERQLEVRAAMANEMAKLKDDYEKFRQKKLNDCSNTMSPSARNSRISALENMLATSSSTLVSMASQLSEAEERERVFSSKGRWNQIRSLPEAKNLMNLLFSLASTSRCQLRDKELICSEKDNVIRELKEKIVTLNTVVRQQESKIAMLHSQNMKREMAGNFGSRTSSSGDDEYRYDLRKAPRKSNFIANSLNNGELLEDMDTSESAHSDDDLDSEASDSDWVNSSKAVKKRPRTSTRYTRPSLDKKSEIGLEVFNEAAADALESDKTICCTCSKKSSCKTKKCECRATNGFCGTSCGCKKKCANRESGSKNPLDDLSQSEVPEGTANERTTILATHGAILLQNALSDISSTPKMEDKSQRRPLSDIGNKAVLPDLPKPSKRKNWRKSVAIKIVPAPSQPPLLPDNTDSVSLITRDEVTLKLPRAMNPTHVISHPLTERNSISDDPKETSRLDEEKGKENDIA